MITLREWCEHYLRERYALGVSQAAELRRVARQFQEWAGDPVPLAEVSAALPDWLRYLLARGYAAATVNDRRARVLTLLWDAADQGQCPPPRKPRKIRQPRDPPEAWTVEQVSELLWTAQHWPGSVGEVPASLWWDALFAATYWTGTRIGALRQCAKTDYHDGLLRIRGRSQKNRHGQVFPLPAHGAEKIERIISYPGTKLWPWPFHSRYLWTVARRIIERAGLSAPKTGRSLFHRLRRTHVSYAAVHSLALAQRAAGHASPATMLLYIDPRIAPEPAAAELLPVPQF